MQMFADDADDFDVVRRAALRLLSVTDVLTDGVFIWEKLLRQFLIDDGDSAAIFLFAFRLSEVAPAQKFHAERVEVVGCDSCIECNDAWVSRFRVGGHRIFHSNNPP